MRRKFLIIIILVGLLFILGAFGLRFYKGTLSVEAQIIYNMGGPQPVARQNFYLLDVDPLTLDGNDPKYLAKFNSAKTNSDKEVLALASVMFLMLKDSVEKKQFSDNSEKKLLGAVEMTKPFWDSHLVSSMQTDFSGKGKFENIKPGDYWLMGMSETRAGFSFWNIKVAVSAGEKNIILDQSNSLYSK